MNVDESNSDMSFSFRRETSESDSGENVIAILEVKLDRYRVDFFHEVLNLPAPGG